MDDRKLLEKAREIPSFEALKNLFDRFEQMLDQKEPQPKSIVWEPNVGEEYHCVSTQGLVWLDYYHGHTDKLRLDHHNIYKTRELAEKATEHQKRFNMVAQAVHNLEPDQVVDWKDKHQPKHRVYFDHDKGLWERCTVRFKDGGFPPLTDEKNIQPLLDYLNAKEKENG
jgi:hypothetical protein